MSTFNKWLAAAIVAIGACLAASGWAKGPVDTQVGKHVDDFSLQDFRGKSHSLAELKDAKIVVLAFLGVECPLSKLYAPRLAELAAQYEAQGVRFVAIDANRQDAMTEMGQFAELHGLRFPFLKDLNNSLADKLGATRNPQVFVLDAERVVRYTGRIDDQYGFDTGSGYAKTRINHRDLVGALDELLAGKSVSQPRTDAIGCLIGRVRTPDAASDVTYSKQIARLFQTKCVDCHRPGQIGPFALENYDEAAGWAEMIAEVVRDGRMPPWHADPKFGHFRNNLSLSADEKQLIYKWASAGAPEGNPQDLPVAKQYSGSWMMPGGPEKIIYMTDSPVDVPAEGTIDYRYYVAETGFTEDKWIKSAECMPGNRSVVHHIIVSLAPPNTPTGLLDLSKRNAGGEAADESSDEQRESGRRSSRSGRDGQAAFGMVFGFAPGTRPVVYPPGMAKLIPAGWKLVFQLHYTANGSPATDRTAVGFRFCKPDEVQYRVATANASNGSFEIPAGDPAHQVESTREYKKDVLLLSLFPHMHVRGKDFLYEVRYPDGAQETLMNTPRYDFNWQTWYELTEPKRLPAGTVLHCTAHFDNSADNPANPDPATPVRWGPQTWEEMMIGWFDIAVPKDADMAEVLSTPGGGRSRGQQDENETE